MDSADIQDGMEGYEDQEEISARLNTPGPSDDEIENEERYEKIGRASCRERVF